MSGLVQRTCSLAKFGRPSASLATTSPSSTAARQLAQQLRDGRETVREIVPIAAVNDNTRADFVGLHSVTVEFHLVQPAVAGRHCLGGHWTAGRDGVELWHTKDLVASTKVRNANWRRTEAALGALEATVLRQRQSEAVVPQALQHVARF